MQTPGSSRLLEPIAQKQDLVQDLVKTLLKKRSELATAYECMPYMIASNQALHQMATVRPLNLEEMKGAKLDGFSDIKIQKFGKEFLTCIQQKLKFLPEASSSQGQPKTALAQQALQLHPLTKAKFSSTHETTWNLWLEGRSLSDISKFRNLAETTLTNHLCEAIKRGFPFGWKDLARLNVDRPLYEHIKSKLPQSLETCKLTDIKSNCLPHVTFDQIKLVLNHVQVRQHLESLNVPLVDDNANEEVPSQKKEASPAKLPENDLWGDEDDEDMIAAESSFAEIDRICEEANTSQTDNSKSIAKGGNEADDDDDDEDFDMDEIAALEQAIINSTDKSILEAPKPSPSNEAGPAIQKSAPKTTAKGVIYDDDDDETHIGPSPAKQPKIEPEPVKNIFRFKSASASSTSTSTVGKVSNKRIIYEDSDDDGDNGAEQKNALTLPRRKI